MNVRVELSDEERQAVMALRRDRRLMPAERDRVEMVLLSAGGWLAPRIATHLGYCAPTVRTTLKRFRAEGVSSIRKSTPGPPPDTARRRQVTEALDSLLGQDRTWTAAQLATALGEQGIALSTRQTRKYLVRMGARWRRTVTTLRHKQNAERVAQATVTLASLKKKPPLAASGLPISMSAASAPVSR
jgi:transposase